VCRFHIAASAEAMHQIVFWRRCQSQLATTFGSDFFLLLVD
jgi:hypothetical protein